MGCPMDGFCDRPAAEASRADVVEAPPAPRLAA